MKKSLLTAAAAAMIAFGAAPHAEATMVAPTWYFNYTGGPVSAAGSFQFDAGNTLTGITGLYSDSNVTGAAITGLVPLGTDSAWTYDQMVDTFASVVVSNAGWLFSVVGLLSNVNLYSDNGYVSGPNVGGFYKLQEVKLNITQDGGATAVPEPGTYALLFAGLVGIGAVSRRKVGESNPA